MANLPIGYTELEYIESTGTQYIDTQFKPSNNSTLELVFSQSLDGSYTLAGTDTGWTNNGFGIGCNFVHFGTSTPSISGYNDGEKHTIIISNNGIILDGIIKETFPSSIFNINYSIVLFANNRIGLIREFSSMKLYKCKLFENSVLSHSFVPCKNSLNEIGLYDLVTASFYSNSGTENFIAGPVINNTNNIYVKIDNIWKPTIGIYTKTNNTW